jgi:hypothetical protein
VLLTGVLALGTFRADAVDGPDGYASVLRIHAGTANHRDSRGLQWISDATYADGGEVRTVDADVIGTDDAHLYREQRFGNFAYDIPVKNGTYRLQLSFAEVEPELGARSFTVKSDDRVLLDRFVITEHVADRQALVVWLTVKVANGSLPLRFSSDTGEAAVAGVELLRLSAATTDPPGSGTKKPATTTTAVPVPKTSPGDEDLPGWTYLFGESFDTNAAAGRFLTTYPEWDAYKTGWPDTSKRGTYDVNQLSVKSGVLHIVMGEGADGKPRTAVPYPLINGRNSADPSNQLYGRYEVRFRSDPVEGYKTAFLLWPKSEVWPRDGEIDFPEGSVDGTIAAFMHRQDGTSGSDQDAFSTDVTYSSWRVATIEWSPKKVRFLLDGQLVGESTKRIPDTPMRWVLQTETCLGGCVIPADARGSVQIDYVKVWKYER